MKGSQIEASFVHQVDLVFVADLRPRRCFQRKGHKLRCKSIFSACSQDTLRQNRVQLIAAFRRARAAHLGFTQMSHSGHQTASAADDAKVSPVCISFSRKAELVASNLGPSASALCSGAWRAPDGAQELQVASARESDFAQTMRQLDQRDANAIVHFVLLGSLPSALTKQVNILTNGSFSWPLARAECCIEPVSGWDDDEVRISC